eukprot:jgi/Ulvmu1/1605/UM111_0034.1
MTGISDVFKSVQQAGAFTASRARAFLLYHLPPALARRLRPHLGVASALQLVCPQPVLPDPRPTLEYNCNARAHSSLAYVPVGAYMYPGPYTFWYPMHSRCRRQEPGAWRQQPQRPSYPLPHRWNPPPTSDRDSDTPTPAPTTSPAPSAPRNAAQAAPAGVLRWALLLPITSRGVTSPETFWSDLAETAQLLLSSIPPSHAAHTTIHIAVDVKDPLLDTLDGRARVTALFTADPMHTVLHRLPPAYAGSICWMWDLLAKRAVCDGAADLFMLIGDDVHFEASGWQAAVEGAFAAVAEETGLPYGCACVAVRDYSFAAFPTFPVLHRRHLEVFGDVFPGPFRNQHGDPFLWEVYRRWGASRFAPLPAALRNRIGGAQAARYAKAADFVWRDAILSEAVTTMERHLNENPVRDGTPSGSGGSAAPSAAQIPCLDIVIPTYRCDVSMLRALAALGAPEHVPVALQTLIVVDRPDAPELGEIQELASYAVNRVVRVYVMSENSGAPMARNTGLAQSFGDHAVLLDDDVVPDAGLVHAYLGAIARYPDAAGFIGVTKLPEPRTLMQHALVACHICFFYSVADRMQRPPWGVTANQCVRARSNNRVWFDRRFPRGGGGEDVDFCLRLAKDTSQGFVAVPGAIVEHPFWQQPLRQVAGWAAGDVLCLETNPAMMFWSVPNWAALVLGSLLCCRPLWALLAVCLEVTMSAATYAPRVPRLLPAHQFAAVLLLATLPPLLQDGVRVVSKVARGRWVQLVQHFDWMAGHADHAAATQVAMMLKLLLWCCAVAAVEVPQARSVLVAVLCCALGAWAWGQGRVMPPQEARCNDVLPLCTARTPFVVLATQRTGSNMLCGLLRGVPGIAMHNELFNDKGVFSHCGVAEDMQSIFTRDAAPRRFLLRALALDGCAPAAAAPGPRGGRAVGFKLLPEHIRRSRASHELFSQVLVDPRIRKVVLVRENRLAVCVSKLRAATTGVYTHEMLDRVRVVIDPAQLQRGIDTYDAYYEYLREVTAGQHVLWLSYEEVCRDSVSAAQRVCEHIGVAAPPRLQRNVFQPQSKTDLRTAVVGWERLRAAFEHDKRAVDFAEG